MDADTRKKRILFFLIILVALFAVSVMIWFFFFSKKTTVDITPVGGGLPQASTVPPRFGFIFGNDTPPQPTSETEVTPATEQPLVKVWDKPTSGNVFVSITTLQDVFSTTTAKVPKGSTSTPTEISIKKTIRATSSLLMFVDRTTGHVYGYDKKSLAPYQMSNTTIPGIYDAYIFNNGRDVLMRYLDTDRKTILSILATISQVKEGEDPLPLIGITSLPKNVSSVSVSASTQKISYLVPNDAGSSIYTITSGKQSSVSSSPFSEWYLSYGGEALYAGSKPSAFIEGSFVKLPYFTRVEGGRTGLIGLPSPTGVVLSSMWSNKGLLSFLSNKGETTTLSTKTIASKCSWLKRSTALLCAIPNTIPKETEGLPDDWYQGRFLFNDSLSFIDTRTGTPYPLYSFSPSLGEMDVVRLNLSEDEKDITFIRKQDDSLWLLKTDLLKTLD